MYRASNLIQNLKMPFGWDFWILFRIFKKHDKNKQYRFVDFLQQFQYFQKQKYLLTQKMMCFILAFLAVSSRGNYISAIQDTWPFQIDYILLCYDSKFMDANPIAPYSDIGTHHITFQNPLSYTPDSVLLTLQGIDRNFGYDADGDGNSQNDDQILKYMLDSSNISNTGFVLKSFFPTKYYQKILISYMTVKNGYGVQLKPIYYSGFTKNNVSGKIVMTGYQQSSFQVSTPSEIFLIPFPQALQLHTFKLSSKYSYDFNILTPNYFRIRISVPNNILSFNNLTINILIIHLPTLNSAIGGLPYVFNFTTFDNITSERSLFFNLNTSSNVFVLSVNVAGALNNFWYFNTKINSQPNMSAGYFDTSTIINRQNNFNSKNVIKAAYSSTRQNHFFVIQMFRKSCSSPYPYLLMQEQRCYDECPHLYYNDSSGMCNKCAFCSDILQCDYCYYSMCSTSEYYIPSNKSCKSCTTIDIDCEKCFSGKCTQCTLSSKKIVASSGLMCKQCALSQYFEQNSRTCEDCMEPNKCLTCENNSYCNSCRFPYILVGHSCLQCQYPYKLSTNNNCNQCEYPYEFTAQNTCQSCRAPYVYLSDINSCKLLAISFDLQTYGPLGICNEAVVYLYFDGNLNLVLRNYQNQWTLNGQLIDVYSSSNFYQNDTMKFSFIVQNWNRDAKIKVRFIRTGSYDTLIKTEEEHSLGDVYILDQIEAKMFQVIQSFVQSTSQSSGYILSSLSVSSLSQYIIGVLWNFQIASYYLFLQIDKPKNLIMFLNLTIEMQNVKILPFQIPNPYQNNSQIITGDQIYTQYGFDLYFLRTNCEQILCLIVFSLFYCILFLIGKKIKSQNIIIKYIRNKMVERIYANISMNFYSIVTVIAFTGSASLTSKSFHRTSEILNYFNAFLGLIISFVFSILHPVILYYKKQDRQWDTQDCYNGLNRKKKYSELVLSIFLISQLLIPVAIPLFHPMFSISIIILSSLATLVLICKMRTSRYCICNYFRIISRLCFIVFNIMFIIYLMIERGIIEIQIHIMDIFGLISMGSIMMVMLLELVEILTQLALDIYFAIKKLNVKLRKNRMRNQQKLRNLNGQYEDKINWKDHSKNNTNCKERRNGIYLKLAGNPSSNNSLQNKQRPCSNIDLNPTLSQKSATNKILNKRLHSMNEINAKNDSDKGQDSVMQKENQINSLISVPQQIKKNNLRKHRR